MSLRVKPLPGDAPAGFAGAVGRFRLKVAVDRDEVRVNDAVSLKVSLDGDGSLLSVPAPELNLPPEIKVFDPEVRESSRSPGGKLDSRKSWEWLLVPLTAGKIRIPPIRFVHFDPVAGRYRILESEETRLTVERGESLDPAAVSRGEVRVQRRDLEFIKTSAEPLARSVRRAHRRPAFLIASLLPLVLVPLIVAAGRRHARLRQDRGLARARRARRRARKNLKLIRGRMEQLDAARFHEEVGRTLVGFVADRFNRSASGLTYEQTDELLASRQVDPTLLRRFRLCLESCDFARFVPAAGSTERRQELLDEAKAVLEELDRAC